MNAVHGIESAADSFDELFSQVYTDENKQSIATERSLIFFSVLF